MPEPIAVALVDDDPLVLRLLTDMLTASGIDVAWARPTRRWRDWADAPPGGPGPARWGPIRANPCMARSGH